MAHRKHTVYSGWMDGCLGAQVELPQIWPQWQTDYFELKLLEKQPMCATKGRERERGFSKAITYFPSLEMSYNLRSRTNVQVAVSRLCS